MRSSWNLCAALLLALLALSVPLVPHRAYAGQLSVVSDLIENSTPASTTPHTITFTSGSAIPPGGAITITPEGVGASNFIVPAGMDYTDMTLSVSSGGGPFVPRTLAALQSPTEDGVTVVSGVGGTVRFDLATGIAGINPTDVIQIVIGANNFMQSPAAQGSYRIRIRTFDASATQIDIGTAMVAMVTPVTVVAPVNVVLPVRFNGLPTGLLPGATTNVLVSLNTDIAAFCKYSTTSGVDFFSMSSTTIFLDANGATLHYINVPVFQNDVFTYYLRCANLNGYPNPDDYVISFEIGVIPNASTTPLPPPPPPTPSGPSGGGGGGGMFLKGGDVTINGSGIPFSTLTILKDGKDVKEDQVSVLGDFSEYFPQLDRGTYTWGVYMKDPDGNLSSTYNSTIYLIGGTNNIIAPVYLSPTIKAATTTVGLGGTISVSGYAMPLKVVQVIMNKQGDPLSGKITIATTTANGNGSWKLTLPTTGLSKATYEVKAQSLVSKHDQSIFSPTLYIGVGENPNPNFKNRADLNHDGKVNLIDFSILLFNWKTSDATADINQDGTVNLTDFSIMLSNWTG